MKINFLKKATSAQTDTQSANNQWTETLRQSELRYRRLFESAQDGILIVNAETGVIIDANRFLIDLLDYPFEQLCGRKLWEIGQLKDIAANCAAFQTLQQNEYFRFENLPLRRRDGKQIQVEFVGNVYWEQTEKVIQCNIRDITARAERVNDSQRNLAALDVANSTNDTLIAEWENLRQPLMSMGSKLGLMELGHKLTSVRALHEIPSNFDEAAFQQVRRDFRRLVYSFNELAALTGDRHLQMDNNPPSGVQTDAVAFINSANGQ